MPEENKEKTQKKRWTLKKVKTRCRTIYWQNFLLTASVVMLTLALLGSAFFALTYSYAIDERSEQMQSKATGRVAHGVVLHGKRLAHRAA